jgi:Raf kinase inhibitor-like YbhB/YbcL family protein
MKRAHFIFPLLLIILLAGGIILLGEKMLQQFNNSKPSQNKGSKASTNMKIKCSAFSNNGKIPSKYTCDGENMNPPLSFSDIPNNSKSLLLIVDDPDAPAGIWTHWILFNIPPDTKEVPENSVPSGAIQGVTSFSTKGYGGPCPPSGTHHYYFKLFALDITLDLPESSKAKDIEEVVVGHILAQAQLIGLYSR